MLAVVSLDLRWRNCAWPTFNCAALERLVGLLLFTIDRWLRQHKDPLRIPSHSSPNIAEFNPIPMAALIVIDMQNDFCSPESPLCVKGALGCLPKVKEAVETARKQAVPVFWVIREHHPSGIDIEWTRKHLTGNGDGAGATLPNSKGAALVDGLVAHEGDITLIKKRFSGFFHTHLDLMLRRLNVKHVVLCGVQTPNCIRATAVDALGLDYEVSVLSDATASKSDAVQENNLEDMRCMGIKTLNTAAWSSTF